MGINLVYPPMNGATSVPQTQLQMDPENIQ